MFFKDLEKPLYGLEIAQALKASPGTTHRELTAMLKKDVISKKKEGALVLYRLNTSHPYFHELKNAIFPKKKKGERLLFISDLHLSPETPADVIEDLYLFLDYAEESATELILLGDIVEMLGADPFQTYLCHKPLFDRLLQATHNLKITYVVGNHDCFLHALCDEGKFLDANISFVQQYEHESLGVFAMHGNQYDDVSSIKIKKTALPARWTAFQQQLSKSPEHQDLSVLIDYAQKAATYAELTKANKTNISGHLQNMAKDLLHDHNFAYVVMGHSHKALLKAIGHGVYMNTGSWDSEKTRQFVEIDKDGGALVKMSDLS